MHLCQMVTEFTWMRKYQLALIKSCPWMSPAYYGKQSLSNALNKCRTGNNIAFSWITVVLNQSLFEGTHADT